MFSGVLFSSGTITATGDGAWTKWPGLSDKLYSKGLFKLVPSDLATDETLDVTIQTAFDENGSGAQNLQVFTQVTNTNAAQQAGLGGVSAISVYSGANHPGLVLPVYFRVRYTVGGSTPSMSFIIYAALSE